MSIESLLNNFQQEPIVIDLSFNHLNQTTKLKPKVIFDIVFNKNYASHTPIIRIANLVKKVYGQLQLSMEKDEELLLKDTQPNFLEDLRHRFKLTFIDYIQSNFETGSIDEEYRQMIENIPGYYESSEKRN